MSTHPGSRNPKRQRQKEGTQARRAAELAALRRRQRNRRIVRAGLVAFVAIAAVLLISALGGDDDGNDEAAETTTTSAGTETTEAAPLLEPLECAPPSGENTDLSAKPTITPPAEPATELTCQDLVVGDGDEVTSNDSVRVHYVGVAQSNGKEFDSSWDRGEPAEFPLSGVIAGWTEGIPGMKVGGRRLLTIPGEKAYGPEGRPPDIGPDDTLVFIVDLLEIKPPA